MTDPSLAKVLITGATGFIGQACLRALQTSHLEVHGLYRHDTVRTSYPMTWHQCDVLNVEQTASIINKIQPDYLIHLAWFVEHGVYWTSEKNIDYINATVNLYKAFSTQGGKKAVFLGTCAEYDWNYSHCFEDKTPLKPTSLYGLAKKQTYELIHKLQQDNHYAPFSWLRLFNIFGSHENPNRLIPYIINSYIEEKNPVLKNPFSIRDYISVDVLAEIILFLLQNDSNKVLNIGSGIALSLEQVANLIRTRRFSHLPLTGTNNMNKNATDRLLPDINHLKKLNIPLNFNLD